MLGDLLSFAGGLIGDYSSSRQSSKNRALTREQMAMQQQQFNAQMDQSIQRRVADASKAGIHPLFALGASAGASPTASIGGGQPATGSALGRALTGIGGRLAAAELESKSASAKRDEAEAAYHNARTKRLEQDMASQGRDGASVVQGVSGGPEVVYGPPEYVAPQVAMSKSPGVEAGTHPGTIDVLTPDGRKVNIPSPNLGLDEISQVDYVYQRAIHMTTDALEAYLRANRKLGKKVKEAVRSIHRNVGGRPVR